MISYKENMEGFIKMSKYAGMREDLVQAGGGNSSYKISDHEMLIKSSGISMSDISQSSGYSIVNYKKIRDFFLQQTDILQLNEPDGETVLESALMDGKRPSIETFLHSVTGKYTLHTHPIVVNALTARTDGMKILEDLFPEAMMVKYATPGIELAKVYFAAFKQLKKQEHVETVFLQNHGMLVSCSTEKEVIDKTETITSKIEDYLGISLNEYRNASKIWNYFDNKIVWRVTDHNIIALYRKHRSWEFVFCPDAVVYLGKRILHLDNAVMESQIDSYMSQYGNPVVIEYENSLYILADSVKKAYEIQSVLSFTAQVACLNLNIPCHFLSDQEQNFLLNWDAEIYRKNIK